jgi:hypothetical protein
MKLTRNALLGAACLVVWSLPAHALGSPVVADTPSLASKKAMLLAYDTAAGSVGFKKAKKKKAKGK